MSAFANLAEIEAYLANRSDVVDGDYGQPDANEEMRLELELREALAMIRELLSAGDFMASNPIGMLTDGAISRWNRAAKAVRGGA